MVKGFKYVPISSKQASKFLDMLQAMFRKLIIRPHSHKQLIEESRFVSVTLASTLSLTFCILFIMLLMTKLLQYNI